MAAYLIAEITGVTDPVGFEDFQVKVRPLVERYGGVNRAGGPPEVKEGNARPMLAAVIEFPSMARPQEFYDAADYQDLKALRQRTTRGNLLFLDGIPAG